MHEARLNVHLKFIRHCVYLLFYSTMFSVHLIFSGFGGLEVACWPLVPKFSGSKPAEAVGFFREKKILSTRSFGREVKPFVPCRIFGACKRTRKCVEVAAFGRNYRPFLAQVVPPFTTGVSGGDTWRCK